jgi:hypothetical protein
MRFVYPLWITNFLVRERTRFLIWNNPFPVVKYSKMYYNFEILTNEISTKLNDRSHRCKWRVEVKVILFQILAIGCVLMCPSSTCHLAQWGLHNLCLWVRTVSKPPAGHYIFFSPGNVTVFFSAAFEISRKINIKNTLICSILRTLIRRIASFSRTDKPTMCNGPTNALTYNETLIQMSHIKILETLQHISINS